MTKIEETFKNFWAIGEYNVQNQNLDKGIKQKPTKAQQELGELNQARNKFTSTFVIEYEGQVFDVCKKAFCNIHGICESRVDNINQKKRTATGTLIPDQRGRTGNHRVISVEQRESVHDHIGTIPVKSSHYTKKFVKHAQYIDMPDKVPTTELYKMYEEFMFVKHGTAIDPVKPEYYRHIFNTYYNIRSTLPKVDVCDFCENTGNQIKEIKASMKDTSQLESVLIAHKEKAKLAYAQLKAAKNRKEWNNKEWLIICIDMQQTFLLPKTSHGTHFYKRKLSVYNFGIVDIQRGKPYFYIWEEFTGRRGASEIYSCIAKWLEANVFCKKKYPMKLRIFADNCGGQVSSFFSILLCFKIVLT